MAGREIYPQSVFENQTNGTVFYREGKLNDPMMPNMAGVFESWRYAFDEGKQIFRAQDASDPTKNGKLYEKRIIKDKNGNPHWSEWYEVPNAEAHGIQAIAINDRPLMLPNSEGAIKLQITPQMIDTYTRREVLDLVTRKIQESSDEGFIYTDWIDGCETAKDVLETKFPEGGELNKYYIVGPKPEDGVANVATYFICQEVSTGSSTRYGFVPVDSLAGLKAYVSNSVFNEHTQDKILHITAEERIKWNKAVADLEALEAGKIDGITLDISRLNELVEDYKAAATKDLNAHIGDPNVHLSANERNKLNSLRALPDNAGTRYVAQGGEFVPSLAQYAQASDGEETHEVINKEILVLKNKDLFIDAVDKLTDKIQALKNDSYEVTDIYVEVNKVTAVGGKWRVITDTGYESDWYTTAKTFLHEDIQLTHLPTTMSIEIDTNDDGEPDASPAYVTFADIKVYAKCVRIACIEFGDQTLKLPVNIIGPGSGPLYNGKSLWETSGIEERVQDLKDDLARAVHRSIDKKLGYADMESDARWDVYRDSLIKSICQQAITDEFEELFTGKNIRDPSKSHILIEGVEDYIKSKQALGYSVYNAKLEVEDVSTYQNSAGDIMPVYFTTDNALIPQSPDVVGPFQYNWPGSLTGVMFDKILVGNANTEHITNAKLRVSGVKFSDITIGLEKEEGGYQNITVNADTLRELANAIFRKSEGSITDEALEDIIVKAGNSITIEAVESLTAKAKNANAEIEETASLSAKNLNKTIAETETSTAKNVETSVEETAHLSTKDAIVEAVENAKVTAATVNVKAVNTEVTTDENTQLSSKNMSVAIVEALNVSSDAAHIEAKNSEATIGETAQLTAKNVTANVSENVGISTDTIHTEARTSETSIDETAKLSAKNVITEVTANVNTTATNVKTTVVETAQLTTKDAVINASGNVSTNADVIHTEANNFEATVAEASQLTTNSLAVIASEGINVGAKNIEATAIEAVQLTAKSITANASGNAAVTADSVHIEVGNANTIIAEAASLSAKNAEATITETTHILSKDINIEASGNATTAITETAQLSAKNVSTSAAENATVNAANVHTEAVSDIEIIAGETAHISAKNTSIEATEKAALKAAIVEIGKDTYDYDAEKTSTVKIYGQEADERYAGRATFEAGIAKEKAERIAADEAEKQAREAAITAEENARIAADNAENERAVAKEAEIENALANEATTARAAEKVITDNLTKEIADRKTAVTAETERATAAEATLTDNLTKEVSNREAAITSESNRAVMAEITLDKALAKEVSDRKTAVSGEATTRESEDTRIEAKFDKAIADETARATKAEGDLSTALEAEVEARTEAITAEETTRTSEDKKISDSLTVEAARAKEAESTLDTAIKAEAAKSIADNEALKTTLTEAITTAKGEAIADAEAKNEALHTVITEEVKTSIATETSARETAINNAKVSIKNEYTSAIAAAVSPLQEENTSLSAKLEAAEKTISTLTSSLETANTKISSLTADVQALTERLTSLEEKVASYHPTEENPQPTTGE